MDQANILSFLAITILLIVTPGADMALITGATIKRGQFGALMVMLGINSASILWTILAAVGFVALANAVPFANQALMGVGALYMGYVGIKDIRSGLRLRRGGSGQNDAGLSETNVELFRKGFLVNISNPKIGLYYATVLPNFLQTGVDQGKYILLMGITHNILGFLWFMTFAALLTRGANLLSSQRARSMITIATGCALVLFAGLALYYLAIRTT